MCIILWQFLVNSESTVLCQLMCFELHETVVEEARIEAAVAFKGSTVRDYCALIPAYHWQSHCTLLSVPCSQLESS